MQFVILGVQRPLKIFRCPNRSFSAFAVIGGKKNEAIRKRYEVHSMGMVRFMFMDVIRYSFISGRTQIKRRQLYEDFSFQTLKLIIFCCKTLVPDHSEVGNKAVNWQFVKDSDTNTAVLRHL